MSDLAARVRAIPSWQVTLSVALLALGFLIAAQLSAERPRVRYTTQERAPLIETVRELQRTHEQLTSRILDLRDKIAGLEGEGPDAAALVKKLNADLEAARLAAGLIALEGPGVVFRLEDAAQPPPGGNASDSLVTARDIRTLVDELWLAGAEAIAVNGERLTATTAIIDIGGSVLVNSAYVTGPYQVAAIGPKDLYDRVSGSIPFRDLVAARVERHGIRLSFAEGDAIAVPAFAGTVSVRSAIPVGASPAP